MPTVLPSWRRARMSSLVGRLTRYLRRGRKSQRVASLAIWAAVTAALGLATWSGVTNSVRERVFDYLTSTRAMQNSRPAVVVVDIDHASLGAAGNWPPNRSHIARLIGTIASAKPSVIVLDVLIDGGDRQSPAALARQLGKATGSAQLMAQADTLSDGDADLQRALAGVPVVLGVALHPERSMAEVASAPIFARGQIDVDDFWQGGGWVAPASSLSKAAAGLGVLVLAADADGTLRRVPLFAAADGQVMPGLAVSAVRVARKASSLMIDGVPGDLVIADRRMPLPRDGTLRLVAATQAHEVARTVSAAALDDAKIAARLTDRIVILGSSSPEAGGLRNGIGGRLVSTVQVHADAIEQIVAGIAPRRSGWVIGMEVAATLLAGLAAVGVGRRLSPVRGALAVLAGVLGTILFSIAFYRAAQQLFDPLIVAIAALLGFAASALITAAETRSRAIAVRQKFEQHLAPEVVQRIVDAPDALKLSGERRDITAMFTDVEGFTAMTERAGPEALIAGLDAYFDGVSRIIADHGGMIDKIVGDAVHAYFNVPFDLAEHPRRAYDCAHAIIAFCDEFRALPHAVGLGFGRTRIGIESGSAIVGDVGGGKKLDYTAHGNVVNSAARLEAANKTLGSTMCFGPGAAARLGPALLRPLGHMELRGRADAQAVFEPWPDGYSLTERAAYIAASTLIASEPTAARERLRAMAATRPQDVSLARLVERIG